MNENNRRTRFPVKTTFLLLILVTGIILHQIGIFNWYTFVEVGESYAHLWWFPAIVVAIKIVMYTFALPGSLMYWVAGIFYEPMIATVIIVIGGTAGAVSAYRFSQRMSEDAASRITSSRFYHVMQKHSDFITLCAIRTLPNFPHSIINFGAGMLRLPMIQFVLSTIVGFTAKGYLYSATIRNAATADEVSDVISLDTLLPLFILVLLFAAGKLIRIGYSSKST